MSATLTVIDDRATCADCGHRSHVLLGHILEAHGMNPLEYLAAHPNGETISDRALADLEAQAGARRKAIPAATELTLKIMGIDCPVDAHVGPEVCGKLPEGYMFPTKGKAKQVFHRVLMAALRMRPVFLHGMPGTGKDAFWHALSALLRMALCEITFRPGVDLAPMFYTRSIDAEGTGWEYGHVWEMITQGVEARDGTRRPVIVLLSDVDRADQAQAEWFRILCDSMGGRILNPYGKMVPLFPGTRFVCTANSCGSGDARGRNVSSNPIDASLMDRLGRKIKAEYLHWDDECAILRSKFPRVAEMAPGIFTGTTGTSGDFGPLGNATEALRNSIDQEDLYAEFTHRGLCEILAECDDILFFRGNKAPPKDLLKKGFLAWLDGLDADSQETARKLVDSHIVGGMLFDE